MSVKNFLKFVEAQSLIASAMPLVLANLYTANMYDAFNVGLAVTFAVVAFCLQMAVNVWNNVQDFKHAKSDAWREGVNNIVGQAGITLKTGYAILGALVAVAGVLGLWLVTQTGMPLFWMGMIGFIVAYWYAGTPLPLSRTPFGELASGLTMGFLIFLAAAYINVAPMLTLTFIAKALLASAVAWLAIADIMLANNLGDYEEDVAEGRHTLVWYLGRERGLRLFGGLYLAGYGLLILAVGMKILPVWALVTLVSAVPVYKNVRTFQANPAKGVNFIQAIKNAVIISGTFALGLILALIF